MNTSISEVTPYMQQSVSPIPILTKFNGQINHIYTPIAEHLTPNTSIF